jgi:general secretion pathway protein D
VLGGLIGNTYSKANTGIPFFKDIPLVGSAFQSNAVEGDRTELLLLITPYIVRGDEDMADFAEEYASNMNAAFRTGRGWSYTLTPWSISSRFRGLGLDLPSPLPASETPSLLPQRGRTGPVVVIPPAADVAPSDVSAPLADPAVSVEEAP